MTTSRNALILLLGLVGCASRTAPMVAIDRSAPPTPSATIAPAPPEPPSMEMPQAAGCTLTTTDFLPVRFRADSPPFVALQGVVATVALPTRGPSWGAGVRAARGGFTLEGVIAAGDLKLVPGRAIALGGFLAPVPGSRFTWRSSAPGVVIVGYKPPRSIEALSTAGLDAVRLPCSDVALSRADFDPRSAAPREAKEHEAYLAAGTIVPISREPDALPIARLHISPRADTPLVVVETRGKRSLVRWEQPEAVVFGWVSTAHLAQTQNSFEDSFGIGDIGLLGTPEVKVNRVVHCPRNLPLVAEVRGERRTIGSIDSGTAVRLVDPQSPLVSVALPDGLALAEGDAKVGVLASHLGGCTPQR